MTPSGKTPKKDTSGHDEDPLGLDAAGEKALERLKRELAEADSRRTKRGHADRPPRGEGRTTPIAVRFDEFTIKRLRALAERRKTGYQTLLKQFVVERLYEEETREGIIG